MIGGTEAASELRHERLEDAIDLLSRNYQQDPNFIDIFPDATRRADVLPYIFRGGVVDGLAHGVVQAAEIEDRLGGVALWLPPGGFPLSIRRQLRTTPTMSRIVLRAPRSLPRMIRFLSAATQAHTAQPYWYLVAVAVETELRGRGLGRRLLRPVLTRADDEDAGCYLETSVERNVDWYRMLGFTVLREGVSFVDGGPPFWTMWREPGAAQAKASKGRRASAHSSAAFLA